MSVMHWGLDHISYSARAAVARLVGALGLLVAIAIAAVPAPAGAAPTGEDDDIGNMLIQSIAGYTPVPEGGGGLGESSGPLSMGDLAEVVGMNAADLPAEQRAGYARIFTTPSGDGLAMAIGLDVPDTAAVLQGFRDAGESQGRAFRLFPSDGTAFGDIVAYEVESPDMGPPLVLTAFTSGSLTIMLGVSDPDDSIAVLAGMARDQGEITPPSAQVTSTNSETRSTAYRLGQVLGYVLLVALVVGLPAWRAFRRSRRQRPDADSLARAASHSADEWAAAAAPPPPHVENPARSDQIVGPARDERAIELG